MFCLQNTELKSILIVCVNVTMGIGRKILNWYARLSPSRGKSVPPYEHVIQIGDPRLRKVSELVPLDKIRTDEVQNVLKKLKYVINRYNSVGMSAPQIGVNMRIFVIQHTPKDISKEPADVLSARGMVAVPFTVFINPNMKVLDYRKAIHSEGCESVKAFVAEVSRFKEIEVSAFNSEGEQFSKKYSDWPARIIQHELDHLDGKVFTDIMDKKTLSCCCWEEVNLSKGKVAIPFVPN